MPCTLLLIYLLLFLTHARVYAQTDSVLYIGVQGAYQLNYINYGDTFRSLPVRLRSAHHFHAGALLRLPLSRLGTRWHLGLQLGAYYMQQGYEQHFNPGDPKLRATMAFLHVPLSGYVRFDTKGPFYFTSSAGIYYAHLLSVAHEGPSLAPEGHEIYTFVWQKDNHRGIGLCLELRSGLRIGKEGKGGQIECAFGFLQGFSNVLNVDRLVETRPIRSLLSSLYVGLSYLYPISLRKKSK